MRSRTSKKYCPVCKMCIRGANHAKGSHHKAAMTPKMSTREEMADELMENKDLHGYGKSNLVKMSDYSLGYVKLITHIGMILQNKLP